MENLNHKKAVFTTVYVLEEKSPIVYVSHDIDDDWQFFGPEENVSESEARVIMLAEALELEPSIKQLLDMPIGFAAYRKDVESEWMIVSNQ